MERGRSEPAGQRVICAASYIAPRPVSAGTQLVRV